LSVQHHPSASTLLAHATGQLQEGLSLVVATHLAWCADCREAVDAAEAAGGVLLSEATPQECSGDLLERTLAAAELRSLAPPVGDGRPPKAGDMAGLGLDLPEPLRGHIARLGAPCWRRLAPGVRHIPLIRRTSGGGTARLLRIAPGMNMPRHGHAGLELAIVLAGSYRDEIGWFGRGDLADLDQEVRHQPRADEREGCVCLLATEAPLRFEGRLLRWIQPALGV
jgi:putative transcriptional regulator